MTALTALLVAAGPAHGVALQAVMPSVLPAVVLGEAQPEQAEQDAARSRLEQLVRSAEQAAGAVRSGQQALDLAARRSGVALEAYQSAMRGLEQAKLLEQQQLQVLAAADRQLAASRSQLGRWARASYGGGGAQIDPTMALLLSTDEDAADLSTSVAVLERIGRHRSQTVDTMRVSLRARQLAAQAAAAQSVRAEELAVQAAAAKAEANRVLERQRLALVRAQQDAAAQQDKLSQARGAALADAALLARTRSAAATGPTGSCAGGGDLSGYPNGQIPLDALCPVWGAAGHLLRADAAYAVERLSKAYAAQFGAPVCVTDSYRSLAAQIDVFARKPGLAARPGTSNHGWGTALDLCGGIQTFGSAQHEWMRAHAPLYGWFHPSWAGVGGSRPEAWHWEFSGVWSH